MGVSLHTVLCENFLTGFPMSANTIHLVDISSPQRREAFVLATGNAVPTCDGGEDLHNERNVLDLLDRMRRMSNAPVPEAADPEAAEPPEDSQEDADEPPRKRPYIAVSLDVKQQLLALVRNHPDQPATFFAGFFSIPAHNLRKLVKAMKQPGFRLEERKGGGGHS